MHVCKGTRTFGLFGCLFVFLSYLYIDLDLTSIFPLVYQSKIFALIIICLSHTNTHTQRHEGSVNVEDLFIYSPLPLSRSGHLRQLNAHKALLWKHQPASPSLGIWGLTAKQRTRTHTHSFRWSWWYCLLPPLRQSFDFLPIPFSLGWKRSSFWRQFVCCCRLMFL